MKRVLIAGCGYVGQRLLNELYSKNAFHINCIVRTHETASKLSKCTSTTIIDLDNAPSQYSINLDSDICFYFIPPPSSGSEDPRIGLFLQTLEQYRLPEKIILISTTGVYGNCHGEWIDETRPVHPDTDRATRRVDAELKLQQWCTKHKLKYIILRVPGIYGPGKLPIERIKKQTPVLSLSESPWSNRIHIHDLVQLCIRSMEYQGDKTIFNVSDAKPSTMSDYFIQVARVMGIAEPPQISFEECKQQFSSNMISYLMESKKIDNHLVLEEMQYALKYPDLEAGLSALN